MEPLHIKTPVLESHAMTKTDGISCLLETGERPASVFLQDSRSWQFVPKDLSWSGEGEILLFHATLSGVWAWDDADARALTLAKQPGYAYIPPFNHPDIWEGVATVIHESAEQLPEKPGMVVVSVGGGGLLSGVLQGMHDVGWTDVPLVAMETKGADSFDAAVQAGKLVTLDAITSVATCLGARTVAAKALEWTKNHKVINHVCSDKEAVLACQRFADDHRMLVEPACGAALACVYERQFQSVAGTGKARGSQIRSCYRLRRKFSVIKSNERMERKTWAQLKLGETSHPENPRGACRIRRVIFGDNRS
ncbi:hypothetical protein OS493_004124 [Desmophyllum pertusum]|uniref:L-serine ammonia-lyase n=1 Tax=Desmophyllum pertusum TaxID=174260 RepID=A0A9W9ZU58_9CNID|nr:hypothetical protein OS493_004124 [Desmophyllum pertusum]